MTDVAKADQILTQAGYAKNANGIYAKDGKELSLTLAIWGKDTSLYEEIQQELKQAGIAVTLKKLQSAGEVDTLGTDSFDMVERAVVTSLQMIRTGTSACSTKLVRKQTLVATLTHK